MDKCTKVVIWYKGYVASQTLQYTRLQCGGLYSGCRLMILFCYHIVLLTSSNYHPHPDTCPSPADSTSIQNGGGSFAGTMKEWPCYWTVGLGASVQSIWHLCVTHHQHWNWLPWTYPWGSHLSKDCSLHARDRFDNCSTPGIDTGPHGGGASNGQQGSVSIIA